jgi:hypothetical protein
MRRLLGVCLIIATLLWVPIWLFAAAWVAATEDIRVWAFFCGLLGLTILVFLVGAGLTWGRFPTGLGRLAWSLAVVIPLGLFLVVFHDDSGAARVNSAVSRQYVERSHIAPLEMYSQCDYASTSPSGSEWWLCDVEPYHEDADTCHVDVMRNGAAGLSVHIKSCRLDAKARHPEQIDAAVEGAYARGRRVKAVHATCVYAGGSRNATYAWLCRVSALPVKKDGKASMLDRYRETCSVEADSVDGSNVVTRITSCR